MTTFFVSADLGNTRLKLCTWEIQADASPRIQESVSLGTGDRVEAARAWLRTRACGVPIALVSVAGVDAKRALLQALQDIGPVSEPGHGLDVRCANPASVGLDRLFAARGALAELGRDCIVVDAGTALTVDAVSAAEGGVFWGGSIAPGPDLLARSLASGAAQLPLVQPQVGAHAMGSDTEEAIRAGVGLGFRGAARELAACLAREAGMEQAPVVLTGGARAHLLEPQCVFAGECIELPELVHIGLFAAARPELKLP